MLEALLILILILFIGLPLLGMAIWTVVSAAVVGLVIGALARLVVPDTRGLGILPTILLGLVGSIVGGFIGDDLLDTSGFLTVLIEIATAALALVLFSRHRNQDLGRTPRR